MSVSDSTSERSATRVVDPGISWTRGSSPRDRPIDRPQQLGHYLVIDALGHGGMGVVFEAFDLRLDRRVALKVLHDDLGEGRHRLIREAKALAKLSHPNVVQVYEVGEVDGRTFIAMEFVRGQTLREWLTQQPRPSWEECVHVYRQAGKGLAAAHAAGLVHRDFKPRNAVIDERGRPRLLDFGLARQTDEPMKRDGVQARLILDIEGEALETPITQTGVVLGTPAYMPLEQMLGHEADARSDQFGFCVSLYEALYGERPFEGDSMSALAKSIDEGRVRPPPKGTAVPDSVRRVLLRGLATQPEDRWPSMDALLIELRRVAAPRRRGWLGPVVIGLGVVAAYAQLSRDPAPCAGAEERMAAVWNDERRASVDESIRAASRGHAQHTRQVVPLALDDYADQWVTAYTEACEATHVHQEQSEALLDLRMVCLGRRLEDLEAVTAVLADADAEVVDNALATIHGMATIDGCNDVVALNAQQPLPTEPQLRRQVEDTRAQLAQVKAQKRGGKLDEASVAARAALARARQLGYQPLLASAGLQLGLVLDLQGEAEEARATLLDAEIAAEDARDDDALAQIRVALVVVEGSHLGRAEAGHTWARLARATIERSSSAPSLLASLEHGIAQVLSAEARPEEVLEHQRRAIELAQRGEVNELTVATMYNSLATTLSDIGRHEEALEHAHNARRVWEEALGARHYQVAVAMATVGYIHSSKGDSREAQRWFQRSYDHMAAELGRDHPQTVGILTNLAISQANLGQLEESEQSFRQVLAVNQKTFGPDNAHVAAAHTNLGVVLSRRGQFEDALAEHRRALAIREQLYDGDHIQIARSLEEVANVLERLEQHAEALPLRERALKIQDLVLGPTHPEQVVPLSNLAHNLLPLGELARALTVARRALELADDPAVSPLELAYARLVLATVLSERNEQLERVRELFDLAQAGLGDQDAPSERQLLAILAERHGWALVDNAPKPRPARHGGGG